MPHGFEGREERRAADGTGIPGPVVRAVYDFNSVESSSTVTARQGWFLIVNARSTLENDIGTREKGDE